MAEIEIKGSKKYIRDLAKHLKKTHPSIRKRIKVKINDRNTYYTSIDKKHRHVWRPENKRTSIENKHSHNINLKKKVAERGNSDHSHRLLMKKYL